jgi:hypothetical protein
MNIPIIHNLKVENIEWRNNMGISYAFITVEDLGVDNENLTSSNFKLYWGEADKGNLDDIVKILETGNQWENLSGYFKSCDFLGRKDLKELEKIQAGQSFSSVWDALEDDPLKRIELKLRSRILCDLESALDEIILDNFFSSIPEAKQLINSVKERFKHTILDAD